MFCAGSPRKVHAHMHTYTCTYVHVHTHLRTRTPCVSKLHTHTHTHTQIAHVHALCSDPFTAIDLMMDTQMGFMDTQMRQVRRKYAGSRVLSA